MPFKPLPITEAQIDEMVRLYRNGLSMDRIAAKFGCLSGSVWNRLRKRGVPMRSPSQKSKRWSVTSHGYVKFGRNYLHRIIAEGWLGRSLRQGEVVHHRDGNKLNNHPDNLEVCGSNTAHMSEHHKSVWTPERVERLRGLVALGLTSREIAAHIGVSKPAVDCRRSILKSPRPSRAHA